MTLRGFSFCLLTFCPFYFLVAQCTDPCSGNLVLNGDFEQIQDPACSNGQLSGEMFLDGTSVANWFGAVNSTSFNNIYTPDYFNDNCAFHQSEGNCGGNGAAGFFSVTFPGDNTLEWFQGQLSQPLEAGKEYCITFSAFSRASVGAGDGLDVFLLNNSFNQDVVGLNPPFAPVYSNPSGSIIPTSCTTYTFNYCAQGGESWIAFGNKDADQTQTSPPNTQAYVIIDNISLVEICGATPDLSTVAIPETINCGGCSTVSATLNNAPSGTTINWTPNIGSGTGPFTVCPTETTTYEASATIIGCSGQPTTITDQVTVTVDCDDVDVSLVLSEDQVCEGECVTLSATTTSSQPLSYNWSVAGFIGAGPFSDCPSSTTTYSVTATDASGNSATASGTVAVLPPPQVAIPPIGPFCTGDGVQFASATPAGGVWSGDVGPGAYSATYTFTGANGCPGAQTITFEILDAPAAAFAGPPAAVCLDAAPAVLEITPAGLGGTFSGPGVDANTGLFDPAAAGIGVQTITYSYGAGSCAAQVSTQIEVLAVPPVAISPIGPFCTGDGVQFASATPAGGLWSGDVGPGGDIDVDGLGAGAYSATYTFTGANGCPGAQTIAFEILDAPAAAFAGPPAALCLDAAPAVLEITPAGLGGTFSGPGVDANTGLFDPAAAGIGVQTITYSYGAGSCAAQVSTQIEVLAVPPVTISPIGPFCTGDGVQFASATPAGGVWSGDVGPGGDIDVDGLGAGAYSATYTFTGANGCPSAQTIAFEILDAPAAAFSSPPAALCLDAAPAVLEIAPAGLSGTFSGPGVDANTGLFDPAAAGIGVQTITYSYGAGSCAAQVSTQIEVLAVPPVTISPIGPFCTGDGVQFASATPAGGLWSGDVGPGGDIDVDGLGAGAYSATYTFTGANGCPGAQTIAFEILDAPAAAFSSPPAAVCLDAAPAVLEIAPAGLGGTFSGPGVDANTGLFDPAAAGPGVQTITYSYGVGSCAAQVSTQIEVLALPPVAISPIGPFCTGDGVQFASATPAGGLWSGDVGPGGDIDVDGLGAGAYSATYTFTGANGCPGAQTIAFEILDAPAAAFSSPPAAVCLDAAPAVLEIAPAGLGGTFSGPGVDANTGLFDPAAAGIGVQTITYSYGAGSCAAQVSTQIEVLAVPPVTISPIGPFCTGDGVQFASATPAGGVWSGDVGPGGDIDVDGLGAGAYSATYTFTGANGCPGAQTIAFEILDAPAAAFAGPPAAVCLDAAPAVLEIAPAGLGGTFSGPGVDANTGLFDPAAAGIGVQTITYSYGAGSCAAQVSTQIEVLALPPVDIEPIGPFCTGDGVQFVSATPAGGVWSGDVGPGGDIDVDGLGAGAYSATYTFTGANGCPGAQTIAFEILDAPAAAFSGPPAAVCLDAAPAVLEIAPAGLGGTFSGPGVDANTGLFDPAAAGIGVQTITYSYGVGSCAAQVSTQIEVLALPPVTISPIGPFCTGDGVQFASATPAGGLWSGDVGPGGDIDVDGLGAGAYSATYTFTGANGCPGAQTITFEILNPVAVSFMDFPHAICEDAAPVPIEVSPVGLEGVFSGPGVEAGTTLFDPAAAGTGVHTITFSYESEGCPGAATAQITVWEDPVVEIAPVGPFCTGEGLQLATATPSGGFWSGDISPEGMINTDSLGAGTYTAMYTFVRDEGCATSQTISFEILEALSAAFLDPPGSVCIDDAPFELEVSPAEPTGAFSGPGVDPVTGLFNPALSGAGSQSITYSYGAGSCAGAISLDIIVEALPEISIPQIGPFCENDDMQFVAATPANGTWSGAIGEDGEIDIKGLVPGAYDVEYTVSEGACLNTLSQSFEILPVPDLAFGDNPRQVKLGSAAFSLDVVSSISALQFNGPGIVDTLQGIFDPAAAGIGLHDIVVSAGSGNCKAEAFWTLRVVNDWYVPNAFSPNGDGVNDQFLVFGPEIEDGTLTVYDRWGEQVFQTWEPLNNGWDGTFKGKPMNPAVFVWVLKIENGDGRSLVEQGEVSLMR